jgi:hypothetical protein
VNALLVYVRLATQRFRGRARRAGCSPCWLLRVSLPSRNFTVGGNLALGIDVDADLLFLAPAYTWEDPVFGGQAAFNGNGSWLAYAMGGIPVGEYEVGRLANLGPPIRPGTPDPYVPAK